MHVELQEGKLRVARKKHHQEHGATAARTLRRCETAGLRESHRAPDQQQQRPVGGDSWFTSRKCVVAMEKELGLRHVGPVKTNTSGLPQEATRNTLRGSERGASVFFREVDDEGEPTNRVAAGWNDRWHEGFITNFGSAEAGKPASKKRQRTSGRNHCAQAPRIAGLGTCHEIAGRVDRHNRYRQSTLRFAKTWKT
jgi:hypothetical protein